MKHYLLATLILSQLSFGQLTDTTCIKSRWIALKSNSVNSDIFSRDTTLGIENDLVHVIKKLVENRSLKIYNEGEVPYGGANNWYPINYQEELNTNSKDSIYHYWSKDPYFEIVVVSNIPLADIYGEDSIIVTSDGISIYVYPPPKVYVFRTYQCDEIRIKEDYKLNETTHKFEFIPVGLSFYFKGNENRGGHEKFWVDLKELFGAIQDKSKYKWYESIVNKKYQGFQYMQVSCYDDEIKY